MFIRTNILVRKFYKCTAAVKNCAVQVILHFVCMMLHWGLILKWEC